MTIGFCLHFNWGQACILLYFEHSVFTMVDRKFGWSLHGKSAVRGGARFTVTLTVRNAVQNETKPLYVVCSMSGKVLESSLILQNTAVHF